jgi:phage terminase large subunit-like protein
MTATAASLVNYVFAPDLAHTSSGGDYSVILVAAVDSKRNLTIVDGFRDQVTTDITALNLDRLYAKYQPHVVYMDDDVNSRQFLSYLRERASRTDGKAHNRIKPVAIGGASKTERAVNVPAFLRTQQLQVLGTLPFYSALRFELVEFPSANHDDLLDACGLLTHKPTHLPAATAPEKTVATTQNYVAPKHCPQGHAFIAEDGNLVMNVSFRLPGTDFCG